MTATQLWHAVAARDPRADGTFVYAVQSTGIYCRPSCPSRRPTRSAVTFFPAPRDAENAGFRACRRCRPAEPATADPRVDRVRRACAVLASDQRLTLEQLAAKVGGSPHHLQRTFTDVLGLSPREYADACRVGRFRDELRNGSRVTDAVYEAGFGSSSRVYERASSVLGMTPGSYRRGGDGARVRYRTAACPLGRLLVAATDRGVCAVKLGDRDEALVAELQRELPSANLDRASDGDMDLGRWLDVVLSRIGGREAPLDLPLDVRATAFQWRVWKALQRIPAGKTASYGDIARQIGDPRAARAVARACATNPVSVIVPCHRVVQRDGALGGYRWGKERKKALLDAERR